MTLIRYISANIDTAEESGRFLVNKEACLDYLRNQVDHYALPPDGLLLKWIQEATDGSVIPDEFGERARFMVAELVDGTSVIEVFCRKCDESFPRESLIRRSWDNSHEEHGIRIGAAGSRIDCPGGHCLILICDRIY
jgi:hypothetical protein